MANVTTNARHMSHLVSIVRAANSYKHITLNSHISYIVCSSTTYCLTLKCLMMTNDGFHVYQLNNRIDNDAALDILVSCMSGYK